PAPAPSQSLLHRLTLPLVTLPLHDALPIYHPLGTARLAADPAQGVCDPNHRVHGWQGLYVMDGSNPPTSLGANPQVTLMTLASRDRKSTRLNSSHVKISYAVCCLSQTMKQT